MDGLADLSVETLPTTVQIATLPFEAAVQRCLYLLLELVFYRPEEEEDPPFLTVSVSGGAKSRTLTLIAEIAAIERFSAAAPDLVTVDSTEWSVVRVGEGALGFETVGIVERLTLPLAEADIPVLYQSTHRTDYCMIPRDRLDEALDCLSVAQRGGGIANGGAAHAAASATAAHAYPLTLHDGAPAHILRLEKASRMRHTGALIRLLFMPQAHDQPQAIVSHTETADEISLIAGSTGWFAEYCRSEDNHGLDPESSALVAIRIGDADGIPISVTGVVAAQTKVLKEANLPILYMSTYYADYTLVQEEDVEKAAEAFAQAGFTLWRANAAGDVEEEEQELAEEKQQQQQ